MSSVTGSDADLQARQDGLVAQLAARVWVVVTTVGLLLSFAVPWLTDVNIEDGDVLEVSGWRWVGLMSEFGDAELANGGLQFPGLYTLFAVLAALAAAAAAFVLRLRWIGVALAVVLSLLALGHLLLTMLVVNQRDDDIEVLTGFWCAELLMVAAAFAWGYWAQVQREFPDVQ